MFQNTSKLSTVFLLLSIFVIPFYCTLPEDPYDPSKAKMSIILLRSDGTQGTTIISDSTGKTIQIGMVSFLPEYIDSFNLRIIGMGNPDTLDTTLIPLASTTIDTIWKSIVFSTPGTKTVTITPYSI